MSPLRCAHSTSPQLTLILKAVTLIIISLGALDGAIYAELAMNNNHEGLYTTLPISRVLAVEWLLPLPAGLVITTEILYSLPSSRSSIV